MISPCLLSPSQRARLDVFLRRVALAGEPWKAFFDPEVLAKDLRAMGFGHVEDKGPEEINAMYFRNRKDGLRVGSLSHLMKAQV
jgi:O-methyltransferase involved in polyketide biosynthesis